MKKQNTRIFLVCYFAYLLIYVARLNLSMAAPGLKDASILSMEQIGMLGSMFSVIYACGRLLSGILSDRYPPWKMISLGLVLCGISNILFGMFPPFGAILLLWGVNAFARFFPARRQRAFPPRAIFGGFFGESTKKGSPAAVSRTVAGLLFFKREIRPQRPRSRAFRLPRP